MNDAFLVILPQLDPGCLVACACTSRAVASLARNIVLNRRRDLSLGREMIPITCENEVDGEPFPAVEYWPLCFSADARFGAAALPGCTCIGSCAQSSCAHCRAYDGHGRLRKSAENHESIVECSDCCQCSCSCPGRVVSRRLRAPLTVFKTANGRGWGVRARRPLLCGEFVTEYAGEIISSQDAAQRQRQLHESGASNYVMSIQEHRADGTIVRTNIDPTHRGNVGRFFNHSCEPNLGTVLVRADSWVPRLAFFCLRDVPQGEELTFAYGELDHAGLRSSVDRPGLRRICRCNAKGCAGFLPFDPLIDDHHKHADAPL